MGDDRVNLARWTLAAATGSVAAGEAHAGAWTQAPGERLEISTVSRETGDFGETWSSDLHVEYGVADGWGINAKIASQFRYGLIEDDRFALSAGVQRSFALGERASFALQGSVLGAEALDGPDCQGLGYEARAALGASRQLLGREAFVNVEAARRERADGCTRVLTEVAAGIDIAPKWRSLVKVWGEQGDGARTAKVEAGLFRDFDNYSVGLGYRREISGAFNESGVVVSLWGRF